MFILSLFDSKVSIQLVSPTSGDEGFPVHLILISLEFPFN